MREAPGRAEGEPPTGIEVFCVLRHQKSGFLGGAVVFPGGKLDPLDAALGSPDLSSAPDSRTEDMIGEGVSAREIAAAACRETFEEARIIPLDRPLDAAAFEAFCEAAKSGLEGALRQHGLRLALDRLVPWARWVTPEAEQRRFDARFFLLELPPGQVGQHDDHETTMSFWGRPGDILDRFTRGEIFLAPPTTRTLELLATVTSARAARALAHQQSLRPICPLFVPDERSPFLALPGDPAHAERDQRVAGPTRFVFKDGRLVSEDPPPSTGGEAQGGRSG